MLYFILSYMERLWFKAKTYGYGWYPCSWQGWTIILVYIMVLLITFRIVDLRSHSGIDTLFGMFVPFIVLTLLLIVIGYKTGERARWKWGK